MTRLAKSMVWAIYSVRSVLGTVDECDLSSQSRKAAIGHMVAVGGERLLLIGRWLMVGTSRPGEQCCSRTARFRISKHGWLIPIPEHYPAFRRLRCPTKLEIWADLPLSEKGIYELLKRRAG